MAADDSLEGAVDGGQDHIGDDDFSSGHINPNAVYSFMNRTENLLDMLQKSSSVGCYYNLLDEAYSSILACCVLWYTTRFGAQAEQKYLGDFVDMVEGFIEGAPELDSLLRNQLNPELTPGEKGMLELMYNDCKIKLLAAVGEQSADLMIRLEQNNAGRYATLYDKLDTLCKALEIDITTTELGNLFSPKTSAN